MRPRDATASTAGSKLCQGRFEVLSNLTSLSDIQLQFTGEKGNMSIYNFSVFNEKIFRSEGEGSSGASGGPESPTGTVTEGDSVSDASPAEMELSASNAELIHGYENFDANVEAGAAPMPEKYASEIFNRSKQYFSVRGVSGSIVEALGDPETSSVRMGSSYISMRPPWDPTSRGTSREPYPEKRDFLQHPFLAPQPRRKRHESVV